MVPKLFIHFITLCQSYGLVLLHGLQATVREAQDLEATARIKSPFCTHVLVALGNDFLEPPLLPEK